MPLTGDFRALGRVSRKLTALVSSGSPERKRMLDGMANAIKALTREQFAKGIDPAGANQAPVKGSQENASHSLGKHSAEKRKAGSPGLQSSKLARGAVAVEVDGDTIRGFSKNPKWSDKLQAHQEGQTFTSKGGIQRRGARGQLISKASFNQKVAAAVPVAWQSGKGYGYARKAGGRSRASVQRTKGGSRTLPARPIYPVGGTVLTERWEKKIAQNLTAVLFKTLGQVQK